MAENSDVVRMTLTKGKNIKYKHYLYNLLHQCITLQLLTQLLYRPTG